MSSQDSLKVCGVNDNYICYNAIGLYFENINYNKNTITYSYLIINGKVIWNKL